MTTRVLGIPPIADNKAHRHTAWADSLVVGGLVCLLTVVLRLVPLPMGLVGLGLFVGGGVLWTQAIRCPKCGDRWAWRSVAQHSWKRGAQWLATLESCPACGFVPAHARPPPRSAELQSAIDRACDALEASSLDVSAAHLLLELLKTDSVIELLAGMHADLEEVRRSVESLLPAHTVATADSRPAQFTRDARACLRHATIHAAGSDSPEITSAMLLLAYFSEASTRNLRRVLEGAGISRYRLRLHMAHGADAALDPAPVEGPVAVIMHNDPFTTLEFVRDVLIKTFEVPAEQADELAAKIHREGSSVIAELAAPAALERVAELRRRALANDFPLRITLR